MCTSTGRTEEDTERMWLLANAANGDGAQTAKRRSHRRFFGVLFAHGTLKDRIVIASAIFAIFVQTIIPPLLMMMLGQFTNIFSKQQATSHVHVNGSDPSPAEIYKDTIHGGLSHETLKFSCISFFVTIVTFIAAFIQKYQWELIAMKQEHRIRRAFMAQILKLDIAWIEKNKASDISHMLHDHIERLYEGISDHIPTTIFILSAVSLSFMVAVHVQWDLALIMMGMAPAFVILRYIYSWLFAKHMQIEQESLSSANKVVSETFQCIRTVISFSGQRNSIEKYQRLIEQSKECASKRHNMSAFMEALIWFLMDAVYLLG
uniref:ABC transmembrane type-1 domain-containing protein n=1 Tax=Plectus sambesii TaxID=2011161 RepID=A0A914WVV8_9BILA